MIPSDALKLRARLDIRDSASKKTASDGIELADVGDFEKDQAFSYGTWIKPSKANLGGAILARMDDASDHRGWDLWLEGGKVASHIISKWEGDALKVVSDATLKPNEWNHVLVTYDGSAKASGIQVYLDGKLLPLQQDRRRQPQGLGSGPGSRSRSASEATPRGSRTPRSTTSGSTARPSRPTRSLSSTGRGRPSTSPPGPPTSGLRPRSMPSSDGISPPRTRPRGSCRRASRPSSRSRPR